MKTLLIFSVILALCAADTPANCTYGDVRGKWTFYMDYGFGDGDIKCDPTRQVSGKEESKMNVKLMFPDVVLDEFGNKGFWTMIYNQGFEAVINGRKFFAFSKYEGTGDNVTSICGETMQGWSHDVLGRQWTCFHGVKTSSIPRPRVTKHSSKLSGFQQGPYIPNKNFIEKINNVQSTWTATDYDEYKTMTVAQLMKRAGGKATAPIRSSLPGKVVSEETKNLSSSLPTNFDWRDVNGQNFVSPVRNQGGCGSCYAFSSMGMLEARINIHFNNKYKPILSPQDIMDCSNYSQGCDGGFPYLIAGKYAEDFGAVEESCNPYREESGNKCTTKKTCQRHYATKYQYVGGYYGACNEDEMKLALYYGGPLSVSFEVYNDFMHYKGGIYQHTGLKDKFNPFELTNHAVLAVGWGEEKGTPYWIVKNSWGKSWGEDGYFRIIRGKDECAIESIAVETFPIF